MMTREILAYISLSLILFYGITYAVPLFEESTYFIYEGIFSINSVLGGRYFDNHEIIGFTFKGYLIIEVKKNMVNDIFLSMKILTEKELSQKISALILSEKTIRVSREGVLVHIDNQVLPYLLIVDFDYFTKPSVTFNISFDGKTNISMYDFKLSEEEGGITLRMKYFLSTVVPSETDYVYTEGTFDGYAKVATYSHYGYAKSYSFYIVPFFEEGLAIDFDGRLVDTNAEREPVDMVAALLEGYLRFLVFSLGPLGLAIYYGTMILAAGLVAAFVYWLVRRLR